jgi:predicted nucleotide-binding protein
MSNFTLETLNTFAKSTKDKTPSEIIKLFMRMIVFDGELWEGGSILVYNNFDKKLHVFNDDDFLFESRYLDPAKKWKMEFDEWEGFAGRAFMTGRTEYSSDVTGDKRFKPFGEGDAIKSIISVPIPRSKGRPIGVASFHSGNGPNAPPLTDDTRTISELAVNMLGLSLEVSAWQLANQHVFVVHGRDTAALNALDNLLIKRGVITKMLSDQVHTGEEILQKLDEIVDCCSAGFVLLTPDDVGRLKDEEEKNIRFRARQNVVFEGGLLHARFGRQRRVCFLMTHPELERPSDIEGVLYEPFNANKPDATRIEGILTKWGIKWSPPK